jgi:small conductance mechanosensitive channel
MLEPDKINDLVSTYAIPWGVNIILAIAIFIVGRIIAKSIVKLVRRILNKSEMDEILINFISSIVNIALLLAIVIAALDQLGVDTTSLIALLGAAGLAIGLALKDSLQNFASGVMLIIFRPFKTGDLVETNGTTGVIEKITIFNTVLRTPDNCEIIVPNGSVYSGNITNFSSKGTRRIDMIFGIGYEDDIKKAKEIMQNILNQHEDILDDPKPVVAVAELADSSVNFHVRPWVKSGDYWAVHFDVTEQIKLAFDDNGISIPYPQMDLHIDKTE